jgi:hypothetical protein
MRNQLFTGSICLTDILELAKQKHSAFSKSAKNDKVYFNMKTWLNEEKDKYVNIMSHQLNSSKGMKDKEPVVYIGNSKPMEAKPIKDNDIDASALDNITVSQPSNEGPDDLPF